MLKLHHLNLMNEIQETALMLNLYEQQQLLRQQQEEMRKQKLQLEQQAKSGRGHSSSQPVKIPDQIEVGDDAGKKRAFEYTSESNKRQK